MEQETPMLLRTLDDAIAAALANAPPHAIRIQCDARCGVEAVVIGGTSFPAVLVDMTRAPLLLASSEDRDAAGMYHTVGAAHRVLLVAPDDTALQIYLQQSCAGGACRDGVSSATPAAVVEALSADDVAAVLAAAEAVAAAGAMPRRREVAVPCSTAVVMDGDDELEFAW
jgi:hypothetical protein